MFEELFWGDSTRGILTHSGLRICMPKGCQGHLCPSYSRPKSGDAGKMRSVSKKYGL